LEVFIVIPHADIRMFLVTHVDADVFSYSVRRPCINPKGCKKSDKENIQLTQVKENGGKIKTFE
jgi:hypothetical protein